MDRLQSLRVFQQVAEVGGFSAAARKLDLAPAAVTRLISDLEQHLGVRLLQRTTRRLSLTHAGTVFLARLRPILSELHEAEIQVRAESEGISGELHLLAPSIAASHLLAAAAAGFQRVHPAVSIEVHVVETADPPVHEYDLALLSEDTRVDSEFIRRTIIRSELVLCASPEYLARCGEVATPEDLIRHRVLRLRSSGIKAGPLALFRANAEHRPLELEIPAAMVSNSIETLLCATLHGAGISAQPSDLLDLMADVGRLRRVLDGWRAGHLSLVAVLASRKFIPPRTRAFLDYLVAHSSLGLPRSGRDLLGYLNPAPVGALIVRH